MCQLKLSAETQLNLPSTKIVVQKIKQQSNWNDLSGDVVRSSSASRRYLSIYCLVISFFSGCLFRSHLDFKDKLTNVREWRNVEGFERNGSLEGKYTRWDSEAVVHPATLAHPNPTSVLVIGGGKHDVYVQDVLSEVLKHRTVRRVVVLALNKKAHDVSVHQSTSSSLEQLEYFDSFEDLLLRRSHYSFDVIILLRRFCTLSSTKPHPIQKEDNFVELSNGVLSNLHRTLELLSEHGIFITHLGASPFLSRKSNAQDGSRHYRSNYDTEHAPLNLIHDFMSNDHFVDVHVYEESVGSNYQPTRLPVSYGMFCKTDKCRCHWYADETYMNYQIQKRLTSPLSFIDGATLRRYVRPPKSWESLFCSFPENRRKCAYMNGFDPSIPNVMRSSFEVKTSSLGKNVGRGLFTKVDIQEGSYLMQEVAVHQVKFSVQSHSIIKSTKKLIEEALGSSEAGNVHFGYRQQEIDSLLFYMDGYGYDDETFGGVANFVDSGLTTFINHGCNRTFNVGSIFYTLDQKLGISESSFNYVVLSEEEADFEYPPEEVYQKNGDSFDPLLDRHFEHEISSYEGSLGYIYQGQELFCNYVHLYGIHEWKRGIQDLRSQCRGESVGIVVEKELTER